ncbi:hypothetical protein [Chitinophaga defluvii]|uniref:Uncharacterized protein n=1 Tax=Chitinophaga defluvii TaxID=3163343 RepID=A0ABV2T8K4_9BACT
MAEIKRRILSLTTGKQIKLFGNSVGIGKTLELGEGYAPNILSSSTGISGEEAPPTVNNPYGLTEAEIMELADYMMSLWLQLKESIRKYGLKDARIFARDSAK